MFFNKTREAFRACCILSEDFGMQFAVKESSVHAKMLALVRNGANRYEAAIAFVLATIHEAIFTNPHLDWDECYLMSNWISTIERLSRHATLTLSDGDPKIFYQSLSEVRSKLQLRKLEVA